MADKNPFPGENNTGHIWDDNLRELANPPPRWWMIAFWASVLWWVVYGVLYPMIPVGDKPTKGVLGWTQMKEYNEGVAEVEAIRSQYEQKISAMSAKEILADANVSAYVTASAKVLYGDNCAACHAAGGAGNEGFPVLADNDWLYGGAIETIEQTITGGRKGIMPAHGKMLQASEIDALANYVVGLSEGKDDEAGKALFTQKGCIACHGMDGKGMQALGSANLTDKVWRFKEADQLASVKRTITHGVNDMTDPETREAVMPTFGGGKLSKDDIKKLAVYVHKFGGGQ